MANSNHTELSALCQGWLRSQGGHQGPSEALMVAIQVTFIHLYIYNIQIWSNRQIFPQVFYALIFLLGVIGNTLVIYVVIRFSKMHTVNSLTSSQSRGFHLNFLR